MKFYSFEEVQKFEDDEDKAMLNFDLTSKEKIDRPFSNLNQRPILMSPNQVVPLNKPNSEMEQSKKFMKTEPKKIIKNSFFLSNLLPNFE